MKSMNRFGQMILMAGILLTRVDISAQNSASHTIIIRIIQRVAFYADTQTGPGNSGADASIYSEKSDEGQRMNLRWRKMLENQTVSVSIQKANPVNPLKIEMKKSDGCIARSMVSLSECAQELLKTEAGKDGRYSWSFSGELKVKDPICVVYTITST